MWFYSRRWLKWNHPKNWHAHRSSSLQRSSGFTHTFKLAEKDWNYKKSFACIPSFKDRLINRKLTTYKSRHLWQCRYYPFASLYATWRGVLFFCAERPIVIIYWTLRYQKWKKIGGKKNTERHHNLVTCVRPTKVVLFFLPPLTFLLFHGRCIKPTFPEHTDLFPLWYLTQLVRWRPPRAVNFA